MPDPTGPQPPAEIAASGAPLVAEHPVPACDVCGGTETEPVAWGYDFELLTCRNRWRFVRCDACGHVWLDPRPDVDALDVIYPPTYYAYNYDAISPVARKAKELLDARKLAGILRSSGATPSAYLDVGCGDGRYLEVLARRGLPRSSLYGLELDERTVAGLRDRGFQAHCERVETTIRFADGSLDLITMFHVIEHVASPRAVVERLASWLTPGGVLALETPNIDSLDARLFRRGTWGGFHIPRHWHLFSRSTLTRLLESVGLEVVSVRYQPGHAFWMYSLHHELRYRDRPRPRLARAFDPFRSVPPLAAFTAFDVARAAIGARTSAILVVARKPGGQPAP